MYEETVVLEHEKTVRESEKQVEPYFNSEESLSTINFEQPTYNLTVLVIHNSTNAPGP
jgi:hypothetical protein